MHHNYILTCIPAIFMMRQRNRLRVTDKQASVSLTTLSSKIESLLATIDTLCLSISLYYYFGICQFIEAK